MPDDLVLWSGEESASSQWSAHAADGCGAAVLFDREAAAMRFDFNLVGNGSWAIARLQAPVILPQHYAAVLELRGQMQPNELQLKLIDPSSANVWWWRRSGFHVAESQPLVLRQANLQFAWGPLSGGEPSQLGAIELAIAVERGGPGTIWIRQIRIEARDPAAAQPRIHALGSSSDSHGCEIARLLDGESGARWRPAASDESPWIQLDLGRHSELGGVVLDFAGTAFDAPATRLFASEDGIDWKMIAQQSASPSPRVWLRTDEGEARHLRIELQSSEDILVSRIAVVPLELAVAPARHALCEARRSRRGMHPRHLLHEQGYWAVVGGDGDERKGLLGEDGALEVGAESFTIEPFLFVHGRLITWADVETQQQLEDGCLPIPSVHWATKEIALRVTAFASGPAGKSVLLARYEVENRTQGTLAARLFLAIRPYQVNPTWQSLNMRGGIAPIRRIERLGCTVHVNEEHAVVAVSPADAFGASASEEGIAALEAGAVPARDHIEDPVGFASGVLAYDVELAAGERHVVVAAAVPLYESSPLPLAAQSRTHAAQWVEERLQETLSLWRRRLSTVPISLPACAAAFEHSIRASVAWILVNQEGPRIQPGPRNYRRSWMRDGAFTGCALAEMGMADELRAFLRWYAPHQLEDGRVPCAVDRRGVDLVAEHDSHGQLIWSIVELYRLTGDEAFLREMWPRIQRAASAISALRAQQTGDDLRGDARYGLLPASISHEGYSSQPVHSYWDDFFALRGLGDAAFAAAVLQLSDESDHLAGRYAAMRADVRASIRRTIADHGIDFIPGSVELGDLDPSSTAVAFDPCQQAALLPRRELERTFELYWERFQARRQSPDTDEAYSAYEARNALVMTALGKPERAIELLQWLVDDQRPAAWRQWPEVSTIDPRAQRFFGDLPHGWIASGFLRVMRRMLAYEHLEDQSLVVAAGLPLAWVQDGDGVQVRGLATYFGPLHYTMKADDRGSIGVAFDSGLRWPRGGLIVSSPQSRPIRHVVIDGRRSEADEPDHVVLDGACDELLMEY
ncbi:MAG TPA: discoidin domain-containing protein [Candidatus Binatia bacterium]|nr:discoidin domain-containing protein [Candidatus Binatia bacterium]